MNEKPLFIPLKKVYFDAFARGEKHTEYRRANACGFTAARCRKGRDVTLSCGYSGARLSAKIKLATTNRLVENMNPLFLKIYAKKIIRVGDCDFAADKNGVILEELAIELEDIKPAKKAADK